MTAQNTLIVRRLGLVEYRPTWERMQAYTLARGSSSADELWLLQHPPVFTLGLNAKDEHRPTVPTAIPVVRTDRGGEITYHGPGQLVAYPLIDLRRRGLGIKHLVAALEQAVIDVLAGYSVRGERRSGAPGVYVGARKIASLGLRVRNGGSYHGLALNVDMDLAPFELINPCGYQGLEMAQLRDFVPNTDIEHAAEAFIRHLCANLRYNAEPAGDQPAA